MPPFRLLSAPLLILALPVAAGAQTANGSPTAPASPGLVGTPRPISRTAPSVGLRPVKPGSTLPAAKQQPPPKPTAAELAEKRKLDHDLKICIGC
jgi:hypothetical protein